MSEEPEQKKKTNKFTWGTFALAVLVSVTAVGEGVKSCNERERAALEAKDRVRVDKDIQDKSRQTFGDLYERIEALEAIVDEQDEVLFELQVSDRANQRFMYGAMPPAGFPMEGSIGGMTQESVTEYGGWSVQGEFSEPIAGVTLDPALVEEEERAEEEEHQRKKVAKKKERLDKPKPSLEFAEPRSHYEKAQEFLDQMKPRGSK